MPVMFCGSLNPDLWKILAELNYFYRQICAKDVSKSMMHRLEKEIMVLVCKIEKVFPRRVVQSDATFINAFTLVS
jgi:hypothetical protein